MSKIGSRQWKFSSTNSGINVGIYDIVNQRWDCGLANNDAVFLNVQFLWICGSR